MLTYIRTAALVLLISVCLVGLYYLVFYRSANAVSGLYYIDGYARVNEVVVRDGILINDGVEGLLLMPIVWVDHLLTGKEYFFTDMKSVRRKYW